MLGERLSTDRPPASLQTGSQAALVWDSGPVCYAASGDLGDILVRAPSRAPAPWDGLVHPGQSWGVPRRAQLPSHLAGRVILAAGWSLWCPTWSLLVRNVHFWEQHGLRKSPSIHVQTSVWSPVLGFHWEGQKEGVEQRELKPLREREPGDAGLDAGLVGLGRWTLSPGALAQWATGSPDCCSPCLHSGPH